MQRSLTFPPCPRPALLGPALRAVGCALALYSLPASAAPVATPTPHTAAAEVVLYTMAPGDNPWTVSQRYLADMADWARVVRLNGLSDARRIAPGTRLRIPVGWLRTEPSTAEVLHHHGAVELYRADRQAAAVRAGTLLGPASRIVTGPMGNITFKLEDGSVFLVRPGSDVLIERLSRPAWPTDAPGRPGVQLRLTLARGAVDSVVSPQKASGRYEIQTRDAVAAVRGTEFRVSADGDATRTEVLGGQVLVGNPQGEALLPRGSGTLARTGQPPEAAQPLLPAPALEEVPALIERFPIDLPVAPVAGAVRYRSQLTLVDAPQQLVADQVSGAARVRLPDMPDGLYQLAVRAIDARGLEGLPAQRLVRVDAHPLPPLPLQPPPGGSTTELRPRLAWTQATDGRREIHLQWSRSADFTGEVLSQRSADTGQALAPQDLEPGLWFWRVAAATAEEGQGPWSDVQTFRRIVESPGVAPPQAQDGQWVLRWPRATGAARYRVEVASTPPGTPPAIDITQDAAELTWSNPPPGTYTVRVQAIDDEGYAGPWGRPQQFTVSPPPPKRHWEALWLLVPLLIGL